MNAKQALRNMLISLFSVAATHTDEILASENRGLRKQLQDQVRRKRETHKAMSARIEELKSANSEAIG